MTDIWTGDILLPNDAILKEIILASSRVASCPAIPPTALRFLSTVNTAQIPLCLAAGPRLDVYTTCEESETWFQSILHAKASSAVEHPNADAAHEWWAHPLSQSPIGILVQVVGDALNERAPRITEILFYGTIAATANPSLPTPPSSSPEYAHAQAQDLPELQVHALPLSSDLLYTPVASAVPPPSPSVSETEPHFLPSVHAEPSAPGSPKRKRDIFDEATQLRRKARRKGGEGVSAAAAKAADTALALAARRPLFVDTKTTPFPDSRPASANDILSRPPSRLHSRSPSISSDIRPLSRKGLHDKRSTLSQVATVPLQPEEPTTETRNKEALSRVVMAAMRMYGLQQRKKNKSRRGSVAPGVDAAEQHTTDEAAAAEEAARDEEYKIIYHQTYKGAALALRKHISTKLLHSQPDCMRDIVEKLLAIFCADPLAEPLRTDHGHPPNLLATPGSQRKHDALPKSTHSQASPFDMPSTGRVLTKKDVDVHVSKGSPYPRRGRIRGR
ncbi:hypothetical protein BCR34DRAFT_486022 [Clohesyomyces aquaticus]|uniref:Sld7 C-terminal domain-containing protein n=1 Tax=Clohesyomyces aquaticus TaxID=1231657 RepID=A0A1Y1ZJ84_9PLEO|nr:hypothetical protein BCR34DRAFT_486022 [Clohesyomyces aquaticus]